MNHAARHRSIRPYLLAAALLTLMTGVPQVWAAQDITGEWEVTMDFGGRPTYATLAISKKPDGTLAGKWALDDLSDVKFDGEKLTFVRTLRSANNEFSMNYTGTVADGKITGTMSSPLGDMPTNAVRRKALSPAVGVWNLKHAVGGQDVAGTLTVSQKPDGTLDAKWVSQGAESVVSNVKFQDGKLTLDRTAKFNDQEVKMTLAGTIQGDILAGLIRSSVGEIPVTGARFNSEIIGEWELTSVLNPGTHPIHMTIYPDLSGRCEFFGGELPMKDVKFENAQLTFALGRSLNDQTLQIELQGSRYRLSRESSGWDEDKTFQMDFKGKVEGKTLKGQMTSLRGTTEMTGKKVEPTAPAARAGYGDPSKFLAPGGAASAAASSIVGTWEFTWETQQGTRTNTLKIRADMTGTYAMRDTEFPITDLKVSGDDVTFKVTMNFGGNDVPMEFKGKMDGKTLKGQFISERGPREAVGKKVD